MLPISLPIPNEPRGINRVPHDILSEPPGTIEWVRRGLAGENKLTMSAGPLETELTVSRGCFHHIGAPWKRQSSEAASARMFWRFAYNS
jgi:hypothetical protein